MKAFPLALVALSVVGSLALAAPVSSQERTAGGSMAAEASWTALQNMINKTNGDVTLLKTDLNAMKSCASQRKLWIPGTGCVQAEAPVVDTSLYDKMLACGDNLMIYDRSANACAAPGGNDHRWAQTYNWSFTNQSNFMSAWSYASSGISDYYGNYSALRAFKAANPSIVQCGGGIAPTGRACATTDTPCYLQSTSSAKTGRDEYTSTVHAQIFTCN